MSDLSPKSLQGIKILLVDDDPTYRLTLAVLLEDDGALVHGASDHAGALDLLREHGPSYRVVILDHLVGDKPGTDLVAPVREMASAARVMMLSGGWSGKDAGVALDAYLLKTITFRELAARIRSLLREAAVPTPTQPFSSFTRK